MIALINTTTQENRESILFQSVLKAYPTHHSWIITAHVSLVNIEKQWKLFTKQMFRTQQLLTSLLQRLLALTQLLPALEAECNSLNSIHTYYQPLIQAATQLLKKEPSFNRVPVSSKYMRRSLLPFLGDALSWLTGTTTTKDVNSIKIRISQLIATQHNQQQTLVHIISIINITRYAKDKDSIQKRCSLQIRKASSISIPTSIAPNAWIITLPTTAVPSGITLIHPGEAPSSVIPQTHIHVLQLQPAYSSTS